jgi:hypothetical protein
MREANKGFTASRFRSLVALDRHRKFGEAGIVGIDDVPEPAHFVDAEPSQFAVFVTDIARFAAMPGGDCINVMARVAVEFRPPFPDRCDQPEPGWRDAGFFLGLTQQRRFEALAVLDTAADRIPMIRPRPFRWRTQAEQHLAVRPDEQGADSKGGLILHGDSVALPAQISYVSMIPTMIGG